MAEVSGYIPQSEPSFYLQAIPSILTKTAVCVDPIIYFGFNSQFWSEMLVLLGLSSDSDRSGTRTVATRRNMWRTR